MERRTNPRYAISLDALVHPAKGRPWLCTIRDFCGGGMLLVEKSAQKKRPGAKPVARAGERVGIHFNIPAGQGAQQFRLVGKIVRVMDSGIGINLADGMDDACIDALLQFSNGSDSQPSEMPAAGPARSNRDRRPNATSDTRTGTASSATSTEQATSADETNAISQISQISQEGSREIIAKCRLQVVDVVPEMNADFFDYMDNELMTLARNASSNAAQSGFFAAMNNLESAKDTVGQKFIDEILRQIDEPQQLETILTKRREMEDKQREQQESGRIRLSLVNADEFEDWLTVANIISRTERMYTKYLEEIQIRLGLIEESWSHNEVNPFGPAVFTKAFDDAIRFVDLSKEMRQEVFNGFEMTVAPLFRRLYISLTELLEGSGLFPDIDEAYVTAAAARKAAESGRSDPVEDEAPEEQEESAAQADEEAVGQADGESAGRAHRGSTDRPYQESTGAPAESAGQQVDDADFDAEEEEPQVIPAQRPQRRASPQGGARRSASGGRRSKTRQTLQNLYSTVRTLAQQMDDGAIEDEEIDEENLYRLEDIRGALSTMQQQQLQAPVSGPRQSVTKGIIEALEQGGDGRRVSPVARENLEVVENLVDTFEQDSILSTSAKDWMRQLEITLDKVATEDSDFLNEEQPHAALEVLDQLANLGASESGSVKRSVDKVVSRIVENFDDNSGVFDEALTELQPLLERQTRAYTGNIERTVKASEGRHTLSNAQNAVVSEIGNRVGGQRIPDVLLKLLVPGWRNLLVNTHLRQGEESEDWQQHLRVIDQLMLHMDETADPKQSPGYLSPEELIGEIESGLESIAYEPGQRAPLVNSLRRLLVDKVEVEDDDLVEVPTEEVAGAIGLVALEDKTKQRQVILDEKESHPDWMKWYQRALALHVGEWLEINDDGDEGQVAIVAWVAEDASNFVFVNRRGVKTHELMTEEVTALLLNGDARILEESDIPLTERASHRMLQDMHNQLTHQAAHDELTGLGNRKEFERQVQRALVDSKCLNVQHVAAYLDLDQFKVINNTSGHEAGDALLVDMAGEIQGVLPKEGCFLARLGGDEFGILLESCEPEEGEEIILNLCTAIRKYRFDWKDAQYNLTTSGGCVFIDADTESVAEILQAAETACFAAKEAGRDRIQIYQAGDSELTQRHGVMEFVSQIDKALEEDRFVLNCQKISPIGDGDEHAHYEILLTVLDDNNEPMPPQDFIVAAETYNRAAAIDRWVIKNAFQWIASNILKLDDLGAFSINVSGNSLNEDGFMEFVLEQFSETRLPASRICFEITETSAIASLTGAIEFMEAMRVTRVQFSLDDFGTGLSSYSYLRNLPVDYLKIDGAFVKDIVTNPNDYAVVKSINEIGHFMGKKTIAEYVEDDKALAILKEIGVDFAQGYGIEKKMPLSELV